jgi:hypothetical protein
MTGASCARARAIHWFLLAVLILTSLRATTQDNAFYLSGRVSDDRTEEPVENVNIVISNTEWGTTTNELGEFILRVDQLPFELEFTHVAYKTKRLLFEHQPLRPLSVRLSRRTESLSEVVITSQRIDTLYADQVYSVLDFELCNKGILLLIFKSRLSRAELLLQDWDGNTLAEMNILPMKPLGLYRDCLGEVHILSQDKAYQVSITDDRMSLYDPYDMSYFAEVMAGCKFMIGSRVFFEEVIYNELIKRFYVVNSLDTSSKLFAATADEEKVAFMRQNMGSVISRDNEADLLGSLNGTSKDANTLSAIRNASVTTRFNKMAYMSAIYAPLFAMGDSVVLFNHPRNMIQFFDTLGNEIGNTHIDYHSRDSVGTTWQLVSAFAKKDKWLKEVYVDRIRNKAYTAFRNLDGTWDLREIDLRTGEVRFNQRIPFPYVQKVQVRDGYLFYLYRGFGQSQKKKLFRQRIN